MREPEPHTAVSLAMMDSPEALPKLRLAPPESAEDLARRVEREHRAAHRQREGNLEHSLAPFRVGSVEALNAVPLTRGLEEEIVYATPAKLAEMLRRDEHDAALVSVVEVLFNDRYDVQSTFSVGFFLNALKWVLCEVYVYYLYATNQIFFIKPWLNIPEDQYRYYQLFFYIPVGILLWIFNAGVIQTLSTALGGKGTFTQTLNIGGIVVFTPFVFIDTIDMLFIILNSGDWNIAFNTITRMLLVLWGGLLLVLGLIEIHELKLSRSILIALLIIPLGIVVTLIFVG